MEIHIPNTVKCPRLKNETKFRALSTQQERMLAGTVSQYPKHARVQMISRRLPMPLLFQLTEMPAAGGVSGCLDPHRLEMGVPPLEQPLVAAPPREGEVEEPGDGSDASSPSASTTIFLSSCNSCEWGGGGL